MDEGTANGTHADRPSAGDLDFLLPLAREVAPLAESMRQAARARGDRSEVAQRQRISRGQPSDWPTMSATKLDGASLFVVSNREPYVHNRQGNAISVMVPASGLVTAIEPILCACNGTWVAHGSGNADVETVDDHDRLQVPPEDPRYTLRRVWLSTEEEAGYYYGFANEGLWPLCHIAHTRPIFRATDWEYYNEVNERFADALAEEMAGEEHPVVLIQDYHFALLPRMMKDRMPQARIAIFWHIPWPNPEAVWHLPLAAGTAGWPARRGPDRVPCSGALQQFSGHGGSRSRSHGWTGITFRSSATITGRRCCHFRSAWNFPEMLQRRAANTDLNADEERRALLAEAGRSKPHSLG